MPIIMQLPISTRVPVINSIRISTERTTAAVPAIIVSIRPSRLAGRTRNVQSSGNTKAAAADITRLKLHRMKNVRKRYPPRRRPYLRHRLRRRHRHRHRHRRRGRVIKNRFAVE